METILTSLTQVRELYDFDYNMNTSQFEQMMARVQRNSLKSLLGDDLYEDITADTPSMSYTNLLPYIYNYCSAAFAAKFVIEGNVFHTNRGNYQFQQDTTTAAQGWQIKQLSENYKSEQNTYANELIEYLNDNATTYTLWQSDKTESLGFSFGIV